ncbi:hypothetical protein ElyMa_001647300 [Elysia marginata]|uniref:Uncharacterized protein n=1 Tax=Elysia marginata TaxID=1093978 RepID=A0AAV4JLV3_9GAST|nr:hypothetical protein ElyMa_001647300 [Elysia marginata]
MKVSRFNHLENLPHGTMASIDCSRLRVRSSRSLSHSASPRSYVSQRQDHSVKRICNYNSRGVTKSLTLQSRHSSISCRDQIPESCFTRTNQPFFPFHSPVFKCSKDFVSRNNSTIYLQSICSISDRCDAVTYTPHKSTQAFCDTSVLRQRQGQKYNIRPHASIYLVQHNARERNLRSTVRMSESPVGCNQTHQYQPKHRPATLTTKQSRDTPGNLHMKTLKLSAESCYKLTSSANAASESYQHNSFISCIHNPSSSELYPTDHVKQDNYCEIVRTNNLRSTHKADRRRASPSCALHLAVAAFLLCLVRLSGAGKSINRKKMSKKFPNNNRY